MKNEKQEAKTTPLGETENRAAEIFLRQAEEWSGWSQALRGFICSTFNSVETQPLKEATLETLNFVESEISHRELLEAIQEVNGVANFVDFLVNLALCSAEEIEADIGFAKAGINPERFNEPLPFYHFMVEFSVWADSDLKVGDLVKLLTSSKEEVINDFVVPFYKIPKSNELDLSGLFEDAFRKGINRLTEGEIYWTHWVFDPIREDFAVSDFVGVFEYVLEAQDEVLKQKEERRIRRIRRRELAQQADEICLAPTDLINEVEYSDLKSRFGQLFSEEWGFFGSSIPLGLLFDLRSMLETLGLNYTFGEVCDFLEGFAFQFDGDAQGCFYEAWTWLGQHSSQEEWEEDVQSLWDCRGFLWESLRKWDSGFSLTTDCERFSLCKADYDFGEVNSLRLQANLAGQGLEALPTPKGFFGDSEGGNN